MSGGQRCWWCGEDPLYVAYHDHEWGFPVADDRRMLEKLVLEGFQSGLSWLTILRKRESFRRAFAGFEIEAVARFDEADVARLLGDAGIVRHRGKIEAAIANARAALGLIERHGSLAGFVWRFEPPPHERPARMTREALAALGSTKHSTALSKELKRAGFGFVGPTTVYAFMQAMGLVNDHIEGCPAGEAVRRARAAFVVPKSSSALA
jgi:DNA-3-methyladenine glycosylase I